MAYGSGLPSPNEQVWGSLLSNYFKRDFVNQGTPAASNKHIVHSISNFDFQPDDLVFILWTFFDRYGVMTDKENSIHFLPLSSLLESTKYYKHIHYDYDHLFLSKVFIEYGINLLVNNNIKTHSLFLNHRNARNMDTKSTLIPIDYNSFYLTYPKGNDNLHMGVQGNKVYAETIYNVLMQNTTIM